MVYTEWLRVRNCLRITGIVVLIILVIGLVVSIATRNQLGLMNPIVNDPQATVVHTVLPNGTHRTILDDPEKHMHTVIDDLGYEGKVITVTEPATGSSRGDTDQVSVGTVHVETQIVHGRTSTVTVETDAPADFFVYVSFGLVVAFILATILGAPFARENDGHLEIALTKPISRVRLALEMIGVDVLGIIAGTLGSIVAWIVLGAFSQRPHIIFSISSIEGLVLGLAIAIAWYAMLAAATASLNRSYGAILGLAWPVSGVVVLLSNVRLFSDSPAGGIFHACFTALARIDPISYASKLGMLMVTVNGSGVRAHGFDLSKQPWPVFVLLIAYIILAVFQWRRVEA